MAGITIKGLTKRFDNVVAVDHLDLEIQEGEFVSLLGPSGCGKTTTLRLIAGFLTPDDGTITVGERVLSQRGHVVPPERRNMSMIFQSYAVWPHMTVFQNVAYGLRLRRLPKDEVERRVRRMLAVVRLDRLADRYPAQLSGGQQQRVALARALVKRPALLLLDEPLSNLDAQLRQAMRAEIRRIQRELGVTAVLVTHDQTEAMTIADW
ncbi:MAG TPA: ABC transporter ATP-binding protein, partial [Limnochordales bacterium]